LVPNSIFLIFFKFFIQPPTIHNFLVISFVNYLNACDAGSPYAKTAKSTKKQFSVAGYPFPAPDMMIHLHYSTVLPVLVSH
jgi:hypothetical protein